MGIEPTRDFIEPHTGFEDQGRHQAAGHLHAGIHRLYDIPGGNSKETVITVSFARRQWCPGRWLRRRHCDGEIYSLFFTVAGLAFAYAGTFLL